MGCTYSADADRVPRRKSKRQEGKNARGKKPARAPAFPSSRDLPGFVNPLAPVPDAVVGMNETNNSTHAPGSTVVTGRAVVRGGTQEAGRSANDMDDVRSADAPRSIGRVEDLPPDDPLSAPYDADRRAGMHENVGARQSLDTTAGRGLHGSQFRNDSSGVVMASSGAARAAVVASTVATDAADACHELAADSAATAGPASTLTELAVAMHRRRMRALVAASGYDRDRDPVHEWATEDMLMAQTPLFRRRVPEPVIIDDHDNVTSPASP
mmetsp:Transcript_16209/g.50294  ORF Transcript_16209/g.50294 Transcript_16209/m.50294 type:complete len:269 (-) Transcript_16209:470-1276(-)